MDREPLKEIIANIEKLIYDDTIPVTKIAYDIVGATMMRDDYDELVEDFRELVFLAEVGVDAEILDDDYKFLKDELEKIQSTFEWFKELYGGPDDAVIGRRVYIFNFLKHETGRGDYYLADSTLALDDLGDLKTVFGDAAARKMARLAGNMLDKDMSNSSKEESSKLLKKTIKDLEFVHNKLLAKQAKHKPSTKLS